MAENIVKFSNNSTIIYLKPAAKFWGCDHSPLICWAASGYEFEKIQVKTVANVQIYVAELVSTDLKNPTLYTAWWYDNGTEKNHQSDSLAMENDERCSRFSANKCQHFVKR